MGMRYFYFQPCTGWIEVNGAYAEMVIDSMSRNPELLEGHRVAVYVSGDFVLHNF